MAFLACSAFPNNVGCKATASAGLSTATPLSNIRWKMSGAAVTQARTLS